MSKVITRRNFNVISTKVLAVMALGGLGSIVNSCGETKNIKDSDKSNPVVLEDQFTEINPKIWKENIVGEAYKSISPKGLTLAVKDTANNKGYSNAEIWNHGLPFKNNVFQITLKNENPEKGSRGWGFWNGSLEYKDLHLAWFAYFDGPEGYKYNGFNAVTRKRRDLKITPINGISLEDSHVYTVDWRKDKVSFWCDTQKVAEHSSGVPTVKTRTDVWVDNAVWSVGSGGPIRKLLDISNETSLHINSIKVLKLAEPYKPS